MKVIILLASVFMAFSLHAQEVAVKVPEVVAKAFAKSYPTTTELKWSQKKDLYKADFKVGKTDHKVWMDAKGLVSKHEYEIKKSELPKAIHDAIAKDFAGYTIDDCERTDENNVATYKVELKSPQGKKKVDFSDEGKVIEKKSKD